MIGELAKKNVGKISNTARFLRYNSHLCYISQINAPIKAYQCPLCGGLIQKVENLEELWTSFTEPVEYTFPEYVFQLRETMFDKLDLFGMPYTENQKPLTKMVISDFESVCSEVEDSKATETTTWIGKHIPILLSITSNLIQQPVFS